MKECAKRMAKFTAWFMGIYTAIWIVLWLILPDGFGGYEFQFAGIDLDINRWLDLVFIAIHLNLLLAGFFWIMRKLLDLDLKTDSDSLTALGLGLVIASLTGLLLIANPTVVNCIRGAIISGVVIFIFCINITKIPQAVFITAGMSLWTTFIPSLVGSGALIGLVSGMIATGIILNIGLLLWIPAAYFSKKEVDQ